ALKERAVRENLQQVLQDIEKEIRQRYPVLMSQVQELRELRNQNAELKEQNKIIYAKAREYAIYNRDAETRAQRAEQSNKMVEAHAQDLTKQLAIMLYEKNRRATINLAGTSRTWFALNQAEEENEWPMTSVQEVVEQNVSLRKALRQVEERCRREDVQEMERLQSREEQFEEELEQKGEELKSLQAQLQALDGRLFDVFPAGYGDYVGEGMKRLPKHRFANLRLQEVKETLEEAARDRDAAVRKVKNGTGRGVPPREPWSARLPRESSQLRQWVRIAHDVRHALATARHGHVESSDEETSSAEPAAKRPKLAAKQRKTHQEPRKEDSKRPSKVSLKRRSKMEDPVWIRANWEVAKEPTAKGDWLVDGLLPEGTTLEKAEKLLEQREAAEPDFFCMARIWAGGWGGQCRLPHLPGIEYCEAHQAQVKRQGYLTHGRMDGEIPPKKKKEFEATQQRLRARSSGSEAAQPGACKNRGLLDLLRKETVEVKAANAPQKKGRRCQWPLDRQLPGGWSRSNSKRRVRIAMISGMLVPRKNQATDRGTTNGGDPELSERCERQAAQLKDLEAKGAQEASKRLEAELKELKERFSQRIPRSLGSGALRLRVLRSRARVLQIEYIEGESRRLEAENRSLKDKLHAIEANKQIAPLQEELLEQTKQRNADLEADRNLHKSKAEEWKSLYDAAALVAKEAELNGKIAELEDTVSQKETEMQARQADLEAEQTQLKEERSKIEAQEELEKEVKDKAAQQTELNKKISQLEAKLEEERKQAQAVSKMRDDLDKETKDQAEKNKLNEENTKLKADLAKSFPQAEKTKLTEEVSKLKAEMTKRIPEAEKVKLTEEIAKLKQEAAKRLPEAERAKLTEEIGKLKAEAAKRPSEGYKTSLQLGGRPTVIVGHFSADKTKMTEEISKLKVELGKRLPEAEKIKLNEEITKLKAEVAKRLPEAEKTKLTEEISKLKAEAGKKVPEAAAAPEAEKSKLTEEITQLKAELAKRLPEVKVSEEEAEKIKLNEEVAKQKAELGKKEAEKTKLNEEITKLKTEMMKRLPEAEKSRMVEEITKLKNEVSKRCSEQDLKAVQKNADLAIHLAMEYRFNLFRHSDAHLLQPASSPKPKETEASRGWRANFDVATSHHPESRAALTVENRFNGKDFYAREQCYTNARSGDVSGHRSTYLQVRTPVPLGLKHLVFMPSNLPDREERTQSLLSSVRPFGSFEAWVDGIRLPKPAQGAQRAPGVPEQFLVFLLSVARVGTKRKAETPGPMRLDQLKANVQAMVEERAPKAVRSEGSAGQIATPPQPPAVKKAPVPPKAAPVQPGQQRTRPGWKGIGNWGKFLVHRASLLYIKIFWGSLIYLFSLKTLPHCK
ncbi:CLEC4M, partial [Symbiodinium microadriaticum]